MSGGNGRMLSVRGTYTIECEGLVYTIEQVPARVCRETGEACLAPGTVARIRELLARDGNQARFRLAADPAPRAGAPRAPAEEPPADAAP